MARPNWEYVRVDVLLMEHGKVAALSDKAFRQLIDLWTFCGRNRNDGIVAAWRWKQVPARARAELLAGPLADPLLPDDDSAGVYMHGYLEHQRSREQIEQEALERSEKARKAAAARWSK